MGVASVHNQVFRSRRYVYAIRFVVDRRDPRVALPVRLPARRRGPDRRERGLCGWQRRQHPRPAREPSTRRGGPDLARVLASETVGAVDRYLESVALTRYQDHDAPLQHGGSAAQARADVRHDLPEREPRSRRRTGSRRTRPTVKASEAGPNGRNTLDPHDAGRDCRPRPARGRRVVDERWAQLGMGPPGGTRASCAGRTPARRTTTEACACPGMAGSQTPTGRAALEPALLRLQEQRQLHAHARQRPAGRCASPRPADTPRWGRSVGTVTVRNLRTQEEGRTEYLGRGHRGRRGSARRCR